MKSSKGIILVAVFAAAAMLAAATASSATKAAPGKVSFLSGKAFWGKAKSGPWKPLKKGSGLYQNWWIKTDKDARMEVQLEDKSVLRMAADSLVKLENLLYSKKGNKKVYKAKLVAGKAWAKVTSLFGEESAFEVSTENAVAGVRGTVFRVNVEDDKSTMVRVYSGVVAVSNAPIYAKKTKGNERVEVAGPAEVSKKEWEEYVAKAMQEVRVSAAGDISKPAGFEADQDRDKWVLWNQDRDKELP